MTKGVPIKELHPLIPGEKLLCEESNSASYRAGQTYQVDGSGRIVSDDELCAGYWGLWSRVPSEPASPDEGIEWGEWRKMDSASIQRGCKIDHQAMSLRGQVYVRFPREERRSGTMLFRDGEPVEGTFEPAAQDERGPK